VVRSSAASDVYKRQEQDLLHAHSMGMKVFSKQ
jgi:hypothetical protein